MQNSNFHPDCQEKREKEELFCREKAISKKKLQYYDTNLMKFLWQSLPGYGIVINTIMEECALIRLRAEEVQW